LTQFIIKLNKINVIFSDKLILTLKVTYNMNVLIINLIFIFRFIIFFLHFIFLSWDHP